MTKTNTTLGKYYFRGHKQKAEHYCEVIRLSYCDILNEEMVVYLQDGFELEIASYLFEDFYVKLI